MKCPFCAEPNTQVVDTRENEDGDTVRRRRRCLACDKRFTTYERVELRMPQVVKKNGSRADYDRDKLLASLMLALRKRPVTTESIDAARPHRGKAGAGLEREVASDRIGELVMRELKKLDKVAYIRFASVYRNFEDVDEFSRSDPRDQEAAQPRRQGLSGLTADECRMSRFSAADHAFMARALRLARTRAEYHDAQSARRLRHRPRRTCCRRRLARTAGAACRGPRAGAIVGAGDTAIGATAYVTLEPCSHFGRTPPCADALIAAGVARVVAAMRDPNPLVAGQGLARLRAAGIEVASGLMEAEATELNIGFVSRMTRGRPWLRLKVAASLDGKTALNNGVSPVDHRADARRDAHAWRARSCAVLTGIGTVQGRQPAAHGARGADQPPALARGDRQPAGNAAGCGDPRRRQCADRGGAGRCRARRGPARARRRDRHPAQ
jgi:transcriptional regulator NrdR